MGRCLQIRKRIDQLTVFDDFEMQVGAGAAAGVAE